MNHHVGYAAAEVADARLGLRFPLTVLYPTDAPARPEAVGPYQLDVARDAPVRAGQFPLVLVSHGTGSSGLVHRNLAHFLARHGYVVALPEHPHNNRDDNSWADTLTNLQARPRHLQLAIDHLLADARWATALRPGAIALIGHSLGAYTALALAGGRPQAPRPAPEAGLVAVAVPPADARLRALVLLAPAVPWFQGDGALAEVHLPVLLLVGERDEHTPPAHARIVRRGLPDAAAVQYREVPNGGHFSFLSQFPAARISPAFPPSQDPPGFDRARFEGEFHAEVLAFLRRTV